VSVSAADVSACKTSKGVRSLLLEGRLVGWGDIKPGVSAASVSMKPSSTQIRSSLLRDRRGAIMVEYVVLLGVCAIGAAAAIVGWGPALVANYETSQGILLSPFP
jgi:Flp pilus assembly pilin Flp